MTRGLDFVFVYLDDLLVTSPDHATHKKHLQILFTCLAEYGIIIGPEKCQFGIAELIFLGHHVSSEGISPSPTAVDAIMIPIFYPANSNVGELFMYDYYRIWHCSDRSVDLPPLVN